MLAEEKRPERTINCRQRQEHDEDGKTHWRRMDSQCLSVQRVKGLWTGKLMENKGIFRLSFTRRLVNPLFFISFPCLSSSLSFSLFGVRAAGAESQTNKTERSDRDLLYFFSMVWITNQQTNNPSIFSGWLFGCVRDPGHGQLFSFIM